MWIIHYTKVVCQTTFFYAFSAMLDISVSDMSPEIIIVIHQMQEPSLRSHDL